MLHTEYSFMTSEELIAFTLTKDDLTNLELELVQRLIIALDQLSECDDDSDLFTEVPTQ